MMYTFPFAPLGAFTSVEPVWKLALRMQIETIALMTRRTQAVMALPTTLATASTPEDYITHQVMYWQLAQSHYMQSLEKITSPTVKALAASAATAAPAVPQPRDYLVVAEGQPSAVERAVSRDATRAAVVPPQKIRRSA